MLFLSQIAVDGFVDIADVGLGLVALKNLINDGIDVNFLGRCTVDLILLEGLVNNGGNVLNGDDTVMVGIQVGVVVRCPELGV